MNIQLTLVNLMVMWTGATILSVIIFLRALDKWRSRDVMGALARLGFGLFLLAVSIEYLWWLLRWLLLDAKLIALSGWFVENAWMTLFAGALGTAGVFASVTSLLWGDMRWRGAAIAAAGVVATWTVGFTV